MSDHERYSLFLASQKPLGVDRAVRVEIAMSNSAGIFKSKSCSP